MLRLNQTSGDHFNFQQQTDFWISTGCCTTARQSLKIVFSQKHKMAAKGLFGLQIFFFLVKSKSCSFLWTIGGVQKLGPVRLKIGRLGPILLSYKSSYCLTVFLAFWYPSTAELQPAEVWKSIFHKNQKWLPVVWFSLDIFWSKQKLLIFVNHRRSAKSGTSDIKSGQVRAIFQFCQFVLCLLGSSSLWTLSDRGIAP